MYSIIPFSKKLNNRIAYCVIDKKDFKVKRFAPYAVPLRMYDVIKNLIGEMHLTIEVTAQRTLRILTRLIQMAPIIIGLYRVH